MGQPVAWVNQLGQVNPSESFSWVGQLRGSINGVGCPGQFNRETFFSRVVQFFQFMHFPHPGNLQALQAESARGLPRVRRGGWWGSAANADENLT